jgi:hypothetical protein
MLWKPHHALSCFSSSKLTKTFVRHLLQQKRKIFVHLTATFSRYLLGRVNKIIDFLGAVRSPSNKQTVCFNVRLVFFSKALERFQTHHTQENGVLNSIFSLSNCLVCFQTGTDRLFVTNMISTSVLFFRICFLLSNCLELVFRSIKVKIVFVKMSLVQISLISKVLQIRGSVPVANIQTVMFLLQLQILINHGILFFIW